MDKGRARRYLRENPRTWLLVYIPVYLLWFFLAERLVKGPYYISYMPLDDKIPFVPQFVFFYVLWYPYLLLPLAVTYRKEPRAFVRYGLYLIFALSISLLICCVFPNAQNLRPADPGRGLSGWILGKIYAADTNTNVLPSMHVVGCAGACMAAFDSRRLRKWRWPMVVMGLLICASTVFVKQHSFLDVLWGAVVALPVGVCIYWLPKCRKKGTI